MTKQLKKKGFKMQCENFTYTISCKIIKQKRFLYLYLYDLCKLHTCFFSNYNNRKTIHWFRFFIFI